VVIFFLQPSAVQTSAVDQWRPNIGTKKSIWAFRHLPRTKTKFKWI